VQNTAIRMSTSVLQILVAETRPHITQTAGALKICTLLQKLLCSTVKRWQPYRSAQQHDKYCDAWQGLTWQNYVYIQWLLHLVSEKKYTILCPRPRKVGRYAMITVVFLSVCPSICPCLTLSREWKGIASWTNRREAHDTGDPWPHLEVKGQGYNVMSVWRLFAHNSTTKS